jgi:hypothetical protein
MSRRSPRNHAPEQLCRAGVDNARISKAGNPTSNRRAALIPAAALRGVFPCGNRIHLLYALLPLFRTPLVADCLAMRRQAANHCLRPLLLGHGGRACGKDPTHKRN